MSSRVRRRPVLAAVVAVWLLVTIGFVVSRVFEAYGGALVTCGELTPGSSDYGSAHFAWSHLGETCTWGISAEPGVPDAEENHTEVDDGWATAAGLVAWGGSIALLARSRRDQHGRGRVDTAG